MATSWGTRKALGRRYGTDPALLLEAERLQQEYNLMPGREARGLQAGQFQQSLEENRQIREDASKQSATSGMIQTGTGALTNAAMMRALTMKSGEGFFGGLFGGGGAAAPTAGTYSTGVGVGAGIQAPSYMGAGTGVQPFTAAPEGMNALSTYQTVTPALVDTTATGMAPAAAGAGEGAAAGAGMGSTISSYATPVAYIGAALAAKNQWGGKDIPWDEKTYWQKSTTAPASILGAGGLLTNLAGADTAVGKFGKEMARGEQTVMKPIEAVFDWIGSWF